VKTTVAGPPASLIFLLQRLLKPLVRLILAKGVTYPMLIDLLKSVYVQTAKEEFTLDDKRQTDSRISLLTGVHRKDVRRLAHETGEPDLMPSNVSLGSQLIALWLSRPEYLDERGHPRPLPRVAGKGTEISFETLVTSQSKDIRPRAVLDEWQRLGVVHVDEADRVCLNVEGFIPEKGFDEKAYYVGHNVHDHLAAGVHNLLGSTPPFLERSVYSDQISEASVRELADLSRELGMQTLQTIFRRAQELEDRDVRNNTANTRMNFGIYFYSERNPETEEARPLEVSGPADARTNLDSDETDEISVKRSVK
jgi:Family of unknown function (DUF6502)